jgi:hypothetical protein
VAPSCFRTYAWRKDFEDDGRITARQHRAMVRWFLDADLDFEAVALLLASVDDTVYEVLHVPKQSRSLCRQRSGLPRTADDWLRSPQ